MESIIDYNVFLFCTDEFCNKKSWRLFPLDPCAFFANRTSKTKPLHNRISMSNAVEKFLCSKLKF